MKSAYEKMNDLGDALSLLLEARWKLECAGEHVQEMNCQILIGRIREAYDNAIRAWQEGNAIMARTWVEMGEK